MPFGSSSAKAPLLRLAFKTGKEYIELDSEAYELHKPATHLQWPVIESTVHPFAMIWKAVTEFGVSTPLDTLLCEDHIGIMSQAQQIYKRWMQYADDNPHLWSPDHPPSSPSPPSNRGSRHPNQSSQWKRRRPDDDDDADNDRPKKRPTRGGSARDSTSVIDEIPSMISYSNNGHTESSPDLRSPSLIDHPVRVAADEEADHDDVDEHRPSDLQPMRKFNISDWAKDASAHGEPVVESCSPDLYISEKPRKPPHGQWTRWRPLYGQRSRSH